MKNTVLVVAAVFVVTLCVSANPTADSPFRARFHLVQTGPPVADARCADGTVLVSFTGSGNISGAGRVSATASHCIVDDPAVEPFTDGEMTLSGRRGDLFIEYEGNDAAGELSGTFVITGGTEEYAGATGGGTLSGRASTSGEGRGTLEGTIDVP
jgi:hypothetical protein